MQKAWAKAGGQSIDLAGVHVQSGQRANRVEAGVIALQEAQEAIQRLRHERSELLVMIDLDALDEPYRTIIDRRYCKGWSVRRVAMPLTFNEQEARHARGMSFLRDVFEGIERDYKNGAKDADLGEQLILASKPVIMARQDVPEGRMGGYFKTDDGERFHQANFRELCKRRGAGCIVVQDYDRTKEPWYKKGAST